MRRESRKQERNSFKTLIYVSGSIALLVVIAFIIGFIAYSNKIDNDASQSGFSTSKISDLVPNTIKNETSTEEASSSMGKTVNEVQNDVTNNMATNDVKKDTKTNSNVTSTSGSVNTIKENKETNTVNETNNELETSTSEEPKGEEEKTEDPVFSVPVEGEILREFAKDKLVYSETLQEWVVHNGIDIKADKTTVVKAAAAGKVSSIKNDPRYELTITNQNSNAFKTMYANLLTAEFVTEGEEVEAEQTIGTVGNTATFEILDEAHLHFEITKDGEYLDPSVYIK